MTLAQQPVTAASGTRSQVGQNSRDLAWQGDGGHASQGGWGTRQRWTTELPWACEHLSASMNEGRTMNHCSCGYAGKHVRKQKNESVMAFSPRNAYFCCPC